MLNPETKYPIAGNKNVIFLKNFITNSNISVGNFTYYHDYHHPENFEKENVIFAITNRLTIGKFCQLAHGTKFLLSDANHSLCGLSAFPFFIFGGEWSTYIPNLTNKGDTVVGNDVWFGHESKVMPGVTIGDGAIVAASAVVVHDVPPYCIVAGNPGKVVKRRFDDKTINELLAIKWWDYDVETITKNIMAIVGGDIAKLKAGLRA